MADTAGEDHGARDREAEKAVQELLLAATVVRKRLIARLDAQIERSAVLADHSRDDGREITDALVRAAREVHPDLEPLAQRLGRVLASVGSGQLSARHLRLLTQTGFTRTTRRVGELAVRQQNNNAMPSSAVAAVSAKVRQHPAAAVLAALALGYVAGRLTQ